MGLERFTVHLARLEPVVGREMRKTRPCVIVSPDELNRQLGTVLIAPLTSSTRAYAWRVTSRFQGRVGQVAIDQMRVVDHTRLVRQLGRLDRATGTAVLAALQAMFAQ